MPETLDPEYMQRYTDAMMRGETGSRLNQSVGIPDPVGYSPPMVTPAPVEAPPLNHYSAANYVRLPQGGAGIDFSRMERDLADVPLDQAQKAIQAAIQYQSQRGYQQDLDSGMSPYQALAKWAPLMLGKGLSGAASMVRATQPKPNFSFVPGGDEAPATFQAPGQRPVIVPRSSMPRGDAEALEISEVMPGVKLIRDRQSGIFKIATGERPMNEAQRLKLMKDSIKMKKDISNMDKDTPEYLENLRVIKAYDNALKEAGSTPGQVRAPAAQAQPVAAPNASPYKEGQRIRSKKDGKTYIVRNGVPVLE